MSRYETLTKALENCAERAKRQSLTLGEVFDSIGEASYGFICIVLTLPFLQPISLGPLATVDPPVADSVALDDTAATTML